MKIRNIIRVSRWVKVLPFYLLTFLPLSAQTALSPYQPGVTSEGAVYFLPKTAVSVTLLVEKSSYQPGEFARYAERFLRMRDVSLEPSVGYRIVSIVQQPVAIADTAKRYAVKFDPKTAASNVRLSDDGVLLAINTEPTRKAETPHFVQAPRVSLPAPRSFMSEEILSAGSTAKMAELTAQDIYEIRESRNLLVRGQADNMPKDGEQLRLMLNQLDLQNQVLTSLFVGTVSKDTAEYTFTIVPDGDIQHDVLFRFSQKLGLLDNDDLAGTPYYIIVKDLKTVPPAEPVDPKKKNKQVSGIYVNIPGKMRVSVSDGRQDLVSDDFPAGQFGHVELLSGALFNKRYTTHLTLHPISGAVEQLDAELPK